MPRRLSDAVVAITGASSGIGRAAALRFAGKGGAVVLGARRLSALETLADECERRGGHARAVQTDVTDERAVENLAWEAIEAYGRLDVWVNNAGVTLFGRIEEVPMEAFRRVVETNLFGYVHGARAALPYFREQGSGVLINNGSMLSKGGAPYLSAYVSSKFGVLGMAESLRQEVQDVDDIHVCTVMPASIDTPLFQHAANYTGRKIKPLDPIYPADKVARAITSLAERPQKEKYVGNAGRTMGALRKVAPETYEKVNARQVESDHFQTAAAPPSDGNLFEPRSRYTSIGGGWRSDGGMSGRLREFATVALGLAAGAWGLVEFGRRVGE